MALLHGGFPPLVTPKVDQHPNQPGLLSGNAAWHGFGRSGSPQKGLLHQVERIVGAGCQPSRQAVETSVMGVEQRSDTVGGPVLGGDRQSAHGGLAIHT